MRKIKRFKRPTRVIRLNGVPLNERQIVPAVSAQVNVKRPPIRTPDGLVNEVWAASYLGLSVSTLQNRRSQGLPPKFIKRGRRVFYREEELEEFANM